MSDEAEQQQQRQQQQQATLPLATEPQGAEPLVAQPRTAARRAYRSDLSDGQWPLVCEQLPPAPGEGRPRTVNLPEVVNAIFYRLRTGCAWEMLPHDLPPRSTVCEYFIRWSKSGVPERLHNALRVAVRIQAGREPTASAALLDS